MMAAMNEAATLTKANFHNIGDNDEAGQRARELAAKREAEHRRYLAEVAHRAGGQWVTAEAYQQLYGFTIGTLANWRHKDIQAGRSEAAPGFPVYKRFGRAIRYWVPTEPQQVA